VLADTANAVLVALKVHPATKAGNLKARGNNRIFTRFENRGHRTALQAYCLAIDTNLRIRGSKSWDIEWHVFAEKNALIPPVRMRS
jgi:hypothetical protein